MKTPDTVEEIMMDPHRYGIPTFEEYRKNRGFFHAKFFGRDDDEFASIDAGLKLIKESIRTQKYFVEGYECKSLEECERVAANMGFRLSQLVVRPELKPADNGKADVIVRFFSKARIEAIETAEYQEKQRIAARARLRAYNAE